MDNVYLKIKAKIVDLMDYYLMEENGNELNDLLGFLEDDYRDAVKLRTKIFDSKDFYDEDYIALTHIMDDIICLIDIIKVVKEKEYENKQ